MEGCCDEQLAILKKLANSLGYDRVLFSMLKNGDINQQLQVLQKLKHIVGPESCKEMVACLPFIDYVLQSQFYKLLGNLGNDKLLDYLWELQKKGYPVKWEKIGDELWVQLAKRLLGIDEDDKKLALEIIAGIPSRKSVKLMLIFIEHKSEYLEKAWQILLGYPGDVLIKELMYQARFSPFWRVRVNAIKLLLNQKEPKTQQFVRELCNNKNWSVKCFQSADETEGDGEIINLGEAIKEPETAVCKLKKICSLLVDIISRLDEDEEEKRLH